MNRLKLYQNGDKKNLLNAYVDAPKKGLRTELEGKDIGEWSKIFLELIKKRVGKKKSIKQKSKK